MKKMLRFVATLICLMMAIASFSACTTGTGNNKPTEEPSKPTEEVVTTTPTVEPTEEPTVEPSVEPTTEPTTTEPAAQAENIPLWNLTTVDDAGLTINQLLSETPPANWFQMEFMSSIGRYWGWISTGRTINGGQLYQLEKPWNLSNIVLSDPMAENTDHNAEIYFLVTSDTTSETYFEIDGSTTTAQFLPLYYNTGKKCLVGYWMNGGATTLVECYWAAEIGDFVMISVEDPSLYGF